MAQAYCPLLCRNANAWVIVRGEREEKSQNKKGIKGCRKKEPMYASCIEKKGDIIWSKDRTTTWKKKRREEDNLERAQEKRKKERIQGKSKPE